MMKTNSQAATSTTQAVDVLQDRYEGSLLRALVDQVRRRLFGNELLAQGVNASNAALAVLILLLLLGTQVLSWYWLVLVPAACAAVGLYLVRRRMPGPYAVAQLVDARMGLNDTLSTAIYFSESTKPDSSNEQVRRLQSDQAERMAASVDARRAAPFRVPRAIYLMALLFLVAGSLFALRYGLNRTLDLKPPLAGILQHQFGWNQKKDQARNDRRKNPPQADDPKDEDAGKDPDQKNSAQPDPTGGEQAAADPGAADQQGTKADDKKQADNSNGNQAGDEQEAQAEKSPDSQNDTTSSGPQNGKQDQQNAGKPDNNSSGDNSGWMSKLKDALENLMSRSTPPKGNPGQDQKQDKQQKGQQNGSKQQSGKDGQQSADQPGDSQDGQNGEDGKNQQQDPNGKNNGKNDGQQKNKQPGSGVGSQDGDKTIKQAQQLEAMGKLSELFGKRAANLTGEATVEVQQTNQQLKTQYVQRGAQHTQNGAEINRDVVPVSLQGYVEQYFEQLRKQTPQTPAGAAKPGAGKPGADKPAADKAPAPDKNQ
jgi:hypothetical protein